MTRCALRLVLVLTISFSLLYVPPASFTLHAAATPTSAPAANAKWNVEPHRTGELLIKFRAGAGGRAQFQTIFGQQQRALRGASNILHLRLTTDNEASRLIVALQQLDGVEWIEPNYLVTRAGQTLDANSPAPHLSTQRSAVEKIEPPITSPATTVSSHTVIAIIDTGLDTAHPALLHRLWRNEAEARGAAQQDDEYDGYVDDVAGWNFVADNKAVEDDHGHGTQVAGLIVAQSRNAGRASRVRLLPLKALNAKGTGHIADVVEAIDYAIARRAAVINCSFGTRSYSRALQEAIERAQQAGLVVVAAAGNNSQELTQAPFYPAGYTTANLLAVAALTEHGQLAEFSNWSKEQVQLAAPGVGLLTTGKGGGYAQLSGTSAAAALVAGAAGALKAERGWVAAQTIRQLLLTGAGQIPALSDKVAEGAVLNLVGALSAFRAGARSALSPDTRTAGRSLARAALQSTAPNLDALRGNLPQPPAAYVQGGLPPVGYEDPKPSLNANYESYLTQMVMQPNNAAGAVGGMPLQAPDPAAGESATGGLVTDVVNKRYHFTAPVLSLGGRAGLNLSLGLHFSSRSLWVRDAALNKLVFNMGRGFPAPGWHLGFGAIMVRDHTQWSYSNSVTQKWGYIYLAPDGTRHDLNYNPATDRLESYDSSYLQFNPYTYYLRMADGAQVQFGAFSLAANVRDYLMLPTQIKDRNGNFISIFYKTLSNGKVVQDYVLDTAGRRIDFGYQNDRLVWIGQNRNGTWFYYARFDYQPITIQTNLSAAVTTDPPTINGAQIWTLSRVTYPTGASLRFSYNGYGSLNKIEKWAPTVPGQGVERVVAYTRLDLYSGAIDADAPGVRYRFEWAENWQGGVERQYRYTAYVQDYGVDVMGPSGERLYTADLVGLIYTLRTFSTTTGAQVKVERATYTQDAGLSYRANPRVSESQITDSSTTSVTVRKTTFGYVQQQGMWLPNTKDEYTNNGAAVYRRTVTDYLHYPVQRILGLPQQVRIYAGAGVTLLAQTVNNYDETGSYTDSNNQAAPYFIDVTAYNTVQHDNQNYGPGLTARGNLTSVTQHNIISGASQGSRITKRLSYDTNGNLRAEADGVGNRQQISYDDYYTNKPAGIGYTLVYPKAVTDPTGFIKGSIYDYFNGNVFWSYNQPPGDGGQQWYANIYDFADRLLETVRPDFGYIYNTYWDNWLAFGAWQYMGDNQWRIKWDIYDGAGRAYRKAGDHPSIPGAYAGQLFVFDKRGRMEDSSNVLQVNGGWTPQGDDATPGFLFTHYTRDELARLQLLTFPDGNTRSYGYAGCGCAGGTETRFTDEIGHVTLTKTDFLGRLSEAAEMSGYGGGTVYNKAQYTYNELDQLTAIAHKDGGGIKTQTRTFGYDGYGRQNSETTPEAGTIQRTFRNNDQVEQVTDARGVITSFTYNTRTLLTNVTYSNNAAPAVTIGYDAHGARQTMTDGEGTTTYVYNAYRQLQSETRTFTGLPGKSYMLSYTYNLADQVKSVNYSISDGSFNKNVNYAYNEVGALAGIGTNLIGSDPNATTNVLNTTAYRAFGSLKSLNYGNGRRLTMGYSPQRQQPSSMKIDRVSDANDKIMDYAYFYQFVDGAGVTRNDGRIHKIIDYLDTSYTTDYTYDEFGRLYLAAATAYRRGYGYDAWGNLRNAGGWTGNVFDSTQFNFENNASGAPTSNRLQSVFVQSTGVTHNYTYDLAGNLTAAEGKTYAYDGAGRLSHVNGGALGQYGYDGDGVRVKKVEGGLTTYYVRSSILGNTAFEVTSSAVLRAYVYVGGTVIAQLAADGQFYWVHTDHLGSGRKLTNTSGALIYRAEFDPHGQPLLEWAAAGNTNLNTKKFTGYERDAATGLDYAMARMYLPQRGRFMQPDPAGIAAADLERPQSLNRYAYVENDPINFSDPTGLIKCGEGRVTQGFFTGQTLFQVFQGTTGESLMAQLVYHEAGTIVSSDTTSEATVDAYLTELVAIGTAILNQYDVDNERIKVFNTSTGELECPLGQCGHRSLKDIIIRIARDEVGAVFDSNGVMRESGRQRLDAVLNTQFNAPPVVLNDTGQLINIGCQGMISSLLRTGDLLNGSIPRYKPNGLVLLYWNQASPTSTDTFPGNKGYIGSQTPRANRRHTFWGLWAYRTVSPRQGSGSREMPGRVIQD